MKAPPRSGNPTFALMKHLFLLRHAKSAWDDSHLSDHDRPLNQRGQRAATTMGNYLLQAQQLPDLILCSTAVRATETLSLMTAAWPTPPPVVHDYGLYLAGKAAILSRLAKVDDAFGTIMVIGHNPGLESLAGELAEKGSPRLRSALSLKFPTGALAVIDLPIDHWTDCRTASGTLQAFTRPMDLIQA